MAEVTLTDQNWKEEVIQSSLPVIVDFWAEWCAPCLMIAPLLKEIAQKYEEKIKVGRLNVEENPSTAQKYEIRAIPFLLFLNGGKPVDQIIGVVPKKILEEKIEKVLKE